MKNLSPRLVVALVPNLYRRCYHVNVRISTDFIEMFHMPLRESSEKYIEKVGPVGSELIRKLDAIIGISEVTLQQYEVGISLGGAFDWSDVEDDILEAIKDCFGDRKNEVEVIHRDERPLYRSGHHDFDGELDMPYHSALDRDDIGTDDQDTYPDARIGDESEFDDEFDDDIKASVLDADHDTEISDKPVNAEPAEDVADKM